MSEIHATKENLVRWAENLPIENIKINHLRYTIRELQGADVITIAIDGETRVLKDRFFAWARRAT